MTKHIKPAQITDADASITHDEMLRILLSADLNAEPQPTEDDLITEAARLRAEIRVAKETKQRLGDIWDKNRTPETSEVFGEAIDRYLDLQKNLKELLGDLKRVQTPQPPTSKRRVYKMSGPKA